MTAQRNAQEHRLTLQPVMRVIINQAIADSNPVFRYKVFDEHGKAVAFITNERATGVPPSWQLCRLEDGRIGESVGDYATAEDALSALEEEFDNVA
jgi:hypothetical protein